MHCVSCLSLTALVYELLYEKVFGISKNTQENTVDNVRTKRYNHKTTCKQQQHNQSAASNSADDSGNGSFTASPVCHQPIDFTMSYASLLV